VKNAVIQDLTPVVVTPVVELISSQEVAMYRALSIALFSLSAATSGYAQTPPAAAPAQGTDVYHVMFVKSAPGQAAALAAALRTQTVTGGIADHKLILRHVEGADWDYVVIQHMGPAASVTTTASPITPPPAGQAANASNTIVQWHNDTFVAGPSWDQFARLMATASEPGGVYVVGVHRALPGHGSQLLTLLDQTDPNAKVKVDHLTMRHIDGGAWGFLSIDRFNSWQDFATDHAATPSGGQGWQDVRQHAAFHEDTLAERIK
jgi:hypothetical protein